MEEFWKDISGYEGLYQVSNLGNVKSLDKYVNGSNQFGANFKTLKKGKILKPRYKNGYLVVHLSKNCIAKDYLIHRLVALTFIPNFNNYPEINHKDENKLNNNVNNLEWCSSKYNCNYGSRNKRIKSKTSLVINQYSKDGIFIKSWLGIRTISKKLNIKQSGIINCCKGKYKTSGGYIWKYANK